MPTGDFVIDPRTGEKTTPVELARKYGKGSPELINALNARTKELGLSTTFRPIGSLAGDIIRTAKPGIALVTAGLGIPALAGLPAPPVPTSPNGNGGSTVPDFRDVLLSAGQAVLSSFAQLPVPRAPTLPAPRAPAPMPRPGAPAPAPRAPGRLPIPIPIPIPGVPSVSDMFGGGARKRRRMNVLNPKALKRSAARIRGFYKVSRGIESMLRKALPRPRAIASHGHKVVSFKRR